MSIEDYVEEEMSLQEMNIESIAAYKKVRGAAVTGQRRLVFGGLTDVQEFVIILEVAV